MTSFNEFDALLQQDVHNIQVVASQCPGGVPGQIGRVQHIAMAAAICLRALMGPAAAAHWLHEVAQRFTAEANSRVH